MNPSNMRLDIFSFTTGIALLIGGGLLFMKGKKKADQSNGGQSK